MVKHAAARTASVRVTTAEGRLCVEISDDGIGAACLDGGSGLRGLADRVQALDGRLTVSSQANTGTTVRAEMPCGS